MNTAGIVFSEAVKRAMTHAEAIVAVETGYLYHRDPHTDTVSLALDCLGAIERNGATPAVTAVLEDGLHIGLGREELIAFLRDDNVKKCNMRDIAWAMANRIKGATTVSAALHAARLAGIEVLAAGGIGGVHRNGAATFDISPDLIKIAQTPVTIVCSGPKAILDIPLTMEYLETQGVAIIGYQTEFIPAYYLRSAGIRLENTAGSPQDIARFIKNKKLLGDESGTIVVRPVDEEYAVDEQTFEQIMKSALREAREAGIAGKGITAFLLDMVSAATHGKSSAATAQIARSNAALAGQIAAALMKL